MAEIPENPPWWGYSSHHGWVVIDRAIPPNSSGRSQDFLFFRCRDSTTFLDKRSRWAAPLYIYASTYIAGLAANESAEAALELRNLRAQWPQYKAEIRHQYETQEADRQNLEKERMEKKLLITAEQKEQKSTKKNKTSKVVD